jgi:uncharacterized protein
VKPGASSKLDHFFGRGRNLLTIIGYISMALVGITLGLIGAGGSILTVPILVYLFEVDATAATAHSMGIVAVSAAVSLVSYWRQGKVNLDSAIKFIPASMVGVFAVRTFILPRIPDVVLSTPNFILRKDQVILSTFALLMLAAARSMLKSPSTLTPDRVSTTATPNKLISAKTILTAFMVGVITGFVGAGGGFLIIPALVNLLKVPMRTAVGTSLLIIAINSATGFLSSIGQHPPDWVQLSTLTMISTIFAVYSSKFSQRVPQDKLKIAFGWFIVVVGVFIILKQT